MVNVPVELIRTQSCPSLNTCTHSCTEGKGIKGSGVRKIYLWRERTLLRRCSQLPKKQSYGGSGNFRRRKEHSQCDHKALASTEVEETTIAIAVAEGKPREEYLVLISDSEVACRNFLKGGIVEKALRVLSQGGASQSMWAPGHDRLAGIHAADAIARGHAERRLKRWDSSRLPRRVAIYWST